MNPDPEEIENSDGEIDTAALAASISEDLFGQESEDGVKEEIDPELGEDGSPKEPAPEADLPPQTENSEEVQALGAPDTWTKEALEKWATIDPLAQAEILKREEDIKKGIGEYRDRAEFGDKFRPIFEPYQPILEAQGVDPAEVTAGLMSNHVMMLDKRVSQEQKAAVINRLLDFYQIDFPTVMKAREIEASIPPEVKQMQARIAELESGLSARERADMESKRAEISSIVDNFKSAKDASGNPLHPHYDLVSGDMAALLQSGSVPRTPAGLAQAYEKAVAMNPELRQLEIDRLVAERAEAAKTAELARLAAANRAKGVNVNTTQTDRNGAVPKGSWEDTLVETAAAISARS